jgi:predicted solute-binding protein
LPLFNNIANDAFIKTICLAIDKTLDNDDENFNQHNLTLEITHLESYYNFRTVEDDFKLVSSGLSIEEKLTPITEIINKTKNQDPKFIIGDETVFQPIITDFENLYVKKNRIQALISEMMYADIINKLPISNIKSYFGRDMKPIIPNNNITIKPNNCREKYQSALKPACNAC